MSIPNTRADLCSFIESQLKCKTQVAIEDSLKSTSSLVCETYFADWLAVNECQFLLLFFLFIYLFLPGGSTV